MTNNVDPDQTADLGLHCLPLKLYIRQQYKYIYAAGDLNRQHW